MMKREKPESFKLEAKSLFLQIEKWYFGTNTLGAVARKPSPNFLPSNHLGELKNSIKGEVRYWVFFVALFLAPLRKDTASPLFLTNLNPPNPLSHPFSYPAICPGKCFGFGPHPSVSPGLQMSFSGHQVISVSC